MELFVTKYCFGCNRHQQSRPAARFCFISCLSLSQFHRARLLDPDHLSILRFFIYLRITFTA